MSTQTNHLKKIIEQNSLGSNFSSIPNYGTDKGNEKNYIDGFYEKNFLKYKLKNITLVEIGVRSGASMCLWKNYFKKGIIYGLDNEEAQNVHDVPVNKEWVTGKNVNYIVGDAYTEEISKQLPKIDILIDDGPHSFESHVKMLELYSDKMNEGGMIVIEDIHYDPNMLFPHVKEKYQDNATVYDFGGWDNRLIVINT